MPFPGTGRSPLPFKRRLLLMLALCAMLALMARSFIGERGLLEVWRQKNVYRQLAAEVETLREQNIALNQEIHALRSDPLAIERIAREQLGYSRPGEITFIFRENEDRWVLPAP